MAEKVFKQGISVQSLLVQKYKVLDLQGEWLNAFGRPERFGTWFIWGNSGSGKSRFVIQLCKELSRFGRVAYNSLEEGYCLNIQKAFSECGMLEVRRRVILINESMETLSERLLKPKSPAFVIVDSFQYSGMNYAQYTAFKERHSNKLIVFVSHSEGNQPAGRPAKRVMFDAALKIWVEGYKAFSKGRYIGSNGGQYTIWNEGANRYWLEK